MQGEKAKNCVEKLLILRYGSCPYHWCSYWTLCNHSQVLKLIKSHNDSLCSKSSCIWLYGVQKSMLQSCNLYLQECLQPLVILTFGWVDDCCRSSCTLFKGMWDVYFGVNTAFLDPHWGEQASNSSKKRYCWCHHQRGHFWFSCRYSSTGWAEGDIWKLFDSQIQLFPVYKYDLFAMKPVFSCWEQIVR